MSWISTTEVHSVHRYNLSFLIVKSHASKLARLYRLRNIYYSICLLLELYLNCFADAQYSFRHWTADNGLPQNNIRGIVQASDGYLWITTFNGIARFDGVRFTVFDKSNTSGIHGSRFGGIYGMSNGDIWFPGRGFTLYHQGEFRTYGPEQGVPGLNGVDGDDAGHIWVSLGDRIAEWQPASGKLVAITSPKPDLKYHELAWNEKGFWAVDDSGLYCFTEGKFIRYPLPSRINRNEISDVGINQRGIVWLETGDGRHARLTPGKVPLRWLPPGQKVVDSYTDSSGHSWKITFGHHLLRSLEYISFSGDIATIQFSRIYEDREGTLWLGTEGQGLYQSQRQSIHAYSKEQGLADRNVYPIVEDHFGAVWMGVWKGAVSRFYKGRFTNYTRADGVPGTAPSALEEDKEGRLWLATHSDVGIVTGGRFHKVNLPFLTPRDVVQAIHQDRTGTLWFGMRGGLVSYKNKEVTLFSQKDGLDLVRVIIESASGDLWIGSSKTGLTRLHNGKFTHWTERDGLPSNDIRCIYEDSDGVIWVGTYDGGLVRLKDGQLARYSVKEGLFNNGVFQILEDPYGNFWISCNRGIYRVSRRELNEYAAGRRSTVTSVAYGRADGMLNTECNGGFWPAGIKARDGKLWFPTQDGVAVVDPRGIRYNSQPPPVVVESLLVDRVPVLPAGTLRIPPGKENLEIQYTGLSFINSEQIQFKYKLEGLDSDWIEAGSRRSAYYSHLPPGKYVFRVIARNSDGVWNTTGKNMAITVLPPFYSTAWFVTLELLATAVLIGASWNRRISKLRRAQASQRAFSQQLIASQENERKRIAAELHDSIGQRLAIINNLAAVFLQSHAKDATQDVNITNIEQISAEAVSAIEETRRISYNLRPFQLDRFGLRKAIESLVRSVAAASKMRVDLQCDDIDQVFPEQSRINVYRIVQECLGNVMKHAQATEVNIRIQRRDERVVFTIRDNGRGFTQNADAGRRGFGLTGMGERASLLGGNIEVQSAPGHGTMLMVDIPIVERSSWPTQFKS